MQPFTKCLLLLTVLFLYLFLGAFVILLLERNQVTEAQQKFFGQVGAFVREHYACGVTPDDMYSLLDSAGVAASRGAFYADMADHEKGVIPAWSWPNSILFATSVATTIGYGRLAPRTVSGQVFCIFYAALGIPLCCFMLSVIGDTFHVLWVNFVRISHRCIRSLKSERVRRVLLGLTTGAMLWVLLALLPGLVFVVTESWNWWRAQYFCFISLSTIGFGDVIYGLEKEGDSDVLDWVYKMGILIYFFIGLTLFSIIYKGVGRSQSKNFARAKENIFRKRSRSNKTYKSEEEPSVAVESFHSKASTGHASGLFGDVTDDVYALTSSN